MLKQPQNSPVPVEEQVVAIYAGTNGFLDDLAVEDVRPFEAALVQYLRTTGAALAELIRKEKELPPREELERAIEEVKRGFATLQVGHEPVGAAAEGGRS